MNLSILAIENNENRLNERTISYCKENDVPLYAINLGKNELTDRSRVLEIRNFLKVSTLKPKEIVLVLDGASTVITSDPKSIISGFLDLEKDILFSADAHFDYPEDILQYYYWKYYPRYSRYYNFLNPGLFMARVESLNHMLDDIYREYHFTSVNMHPDEPFITRYFVDCFLDNFLPSYSMGLDSNQKLLSANRGNLSAARWPYINWAQDHSFQILETTKLRKAGLEKFQSKLCHLRYNKKTGTFRNKLIGTSPVVIHIPVEQFRQSEVNQEVESSVSAFFFSLLAFVHSTGRAMLAFVINRFSLNPNHTFRFEKHRNPDYEKIMQDFLGFLERGEAFTFAHFNDGELNFIRKYLNNDHKKTWNGRIQDQYDVPLAERLVDSIKYKQKNYYLGVSCSTCAAPRRALADELIGDYEHKIGAMVFHHNLRYLPQIIGHMKDREVFFVANDYQNLDFLTRLGVKVKEDNIMRIPFVNSHKVYDDLKDRTFPKKSIVILMCGMLAKILIRNWYEINSDTTFIALGSTMDDFIQTSNTNYRPYPRKLPLARNVHLIKAFLFGNKKKCVECYNF